MALDRRITIQRRNEEVDDGGRVAVTWNDFADVWAERRSNGASDIETSGGIRVTEVATWTVRYTSTLAALAPDEVRIVHGSETWNVESTAESDARRRLLGFTTVREVT